MTTPAREEPLLVRIARGEAEAVSAFIDRHGALIWSISRRLVGASAAEDLVQEILVELWKNAAKFDPARGSEPAFVALVARRRASDGLRALGRRPETIPLEEDEHHGLDALREVDTLDEARVAARVLGQLPPAQRRTLRLSIVEGLTHVEIARLTGMPLGTVKSHVRRGLERVRELLAAPPLDEEKP